MTFKALVLAAAVASVPGLAAAMGCSSDHAITISCQEGTVWDAASARCVPLASS